MLPQQQEESLLRDAVRTMMGQICKVGVSFTSELVIEGTVVVTADRQKIIVIHFDDRLQPQAQMVCDATSTPQDVNTTDGSRFASQDNFGCSSSVGTVCNSGTVPPSRPGWYEGSASSKMMNCLTELDETLNERISVELDSDEDTSSLADVHLEEDAVGSTNARSASDEISGSSTYHSSSGVKKTFRKVKDAKSVIVIEDNELFEPTGDVSDAFDNFGSGELKSLTSFTRHNSMSLADCESISDVSDSRSLLRDFNIEQNGERKAFEPAALACEMCGWHARTLSQLESHLVMLHGVVESQRLGRRIAHVACPLCGKRFRFRAQLDKHSLGHGTSANDRPFQCRSCRNAYRHAQSLALHECVHNSNNTLCGARLHCPVCNKTYPNKVLFQKHIVYMHERVHSVCSSSVSEVS